ncbi:aldehyde ferredoxin oxidoreductase family protein [Chloroflexota bacterium]
MEAKIPGGYNGKILRVNLSNKSVSTEEIDDAFCRKYIGGAGFISYYLWKELKKGVDPLGPDNKLIFALGPITGVPLPGSGRHCVGTKSPLGGAFAKAESGGFWGSELKRAGYDAIIVEGKAEKPVYISVIDGEATIRDASHLWGVNTKETEERIRTELGDDLIRVSVIGPGGENLVRYACIMNDGKDAAGRGGTGAVMGSKNLKAIAVRGRKRIRVVNPDVLKELRQWVLNNMDRWVEFHTYGTGSPKALASFLAQGNLPINNFVDGEFPDIEKINGATIKDTIRIGMDACFACPVRCKKVVKVDEPYTVDPYYGGPEYETLAALGTNCGVSDLKAIAKGNELCNAYSLDTISAGVAISFAMECFENGLLTTKDTGGVELKFGNAEAMVSTIEAIAKRQGIGDLLAEGVERAAQKIGGRASEFAMHVKGLEVPMHDPRVKAGLGLGYAVNPHGADHCTNIHDTMYTGPGGRFEEVAPLGIHDFLPADELGPRKVAMFRNLNLIRVGQDHLGLCQFLGYNVNQVTNVLAAITGWNTSATEMMRVSERTMTTARLLNIREGFSAADDKLPDRFFQPKKTGVLSDSHYKSDELEKAKSYYYTLMGWDPKTGIPLPEKVEELGIE